MTDMREKRDKMVKNQLVRRGIADEQVLAAMREVPREEFVSPEKVDMAYVDGPLPISEGQTISQPYIVALMTEAMELKPEDKALDIGTGSGYAAAILSRIVREVYSVERHETLVRLSEERFNRLGYDNIHIFQGDGTLGWPENAPYDAIVVTAGGPAIPNPLVEQLRVGGRLVIPVGTTPGIQELIRLRKVDVDDVVREKITDVRFVPLIGKQGWQET